MASVLSSVKTVPSGTTINEMVAVVPASKEPSEHSTGLPVAGAAQLPIEVVTVGFNPIRDRKPDNLTSLAELGPLLVTLAVIVTGAPTSTLA